MGLGLKTRKLGAEESWAEENGSMCNLTPMSSARSFQPQAHFLQPTFFSPLPKEKPPAP